MDQILVKKARIRVEKKVFQEEDLISCLPDHILHGILSLLPSRYAAMTSILSHRWLNIWLTFPWVQLDETKFMNREQFFHCLRATFARRNLSNLQKLRLRMMRPGNLELYQLVNRFIDVVLLQGALEKLEIAFLDYVHLRSEELYVLPKEKFSLSSALISLRIEGCRFEGCEPVNLPSLKTLLMKNVIFTTQDFLQELIQGCPVLDNLSIKYCNGIKNLRVSHPTLQKFLLGFCNKMESLELDLPFVKSIKFKAVDHLDDELTQVLNCDKIRARNLRTFRLKHFTMGSEDLSNIISVFPKIEKLSMRYCEVLGNVKLLSNSLTRICLASVQVSEILWINSSIYPNLQSLDLISCKNMKQLRIASTKLESLNMFECEDLEFCRMVALQLSYFSYSGQVVKKWQSVASRNLRLVLHLKGPQGYHDHGEMELLKLTQFLRNFNVSAKAMTIRLTYDCAMCLLMIKDAHTPPLSYPLHLKIETRTQVIGLVDLLRSVLGLSACYSTLSVDVGLFSTTLQFQEIDKEETCVKKTNHVCIEDHLVGVEMRNFQGSDEEVELVGFLIGKAKQMKCMTIWTRKEQKCLNAFIWMHRDSYLFQHFDIVSQGSYILLSKQTT